MFLHPSDMQHCRFPAIRKCEYDQGSLLSMRTKNENKKITNSCFALWHKWYMYKWKASKLFNRRVFTPPHGYIGIQNEVSNKLRKQNICILAFRWKCFTITAQLCFSRRQHPNSLEFRVEEPLRPSNWFILRGWTEIIRLVWISEGT